MGNDLCPRCHHPLRLHVRHTLSSGADGNVLTDNRACLANVGTRGCDCLWTLPQWDEMHKQMSLPETKP